MPPSPQEDKMKLHTPFVTWLKLPSNQTRGHPLLYCSRAAWAARGAAWGGMTASHQRQHSYGGAEEAYAPHRRYLTCP
jgi:hypothetical protein